MQSYNVRVVKGDDGIFRFDTTCFMHRSAQRKDYDEWVDASKRDRNALEAQLDLGGEAICIAR